MVLLKHLHQKCDKNLILMKSYISILGLFNNSYATPQTIKTDLYPVQAKLIICGYCSQYLQMKAVTQTGGWCRSLEGGGRNEHFTRVLRKEINLIKIFAFSTTLGCRAETMRSMDGIKISLVGDAVPQ